MCDSKRTRQFASLADMAEEQKKVRVWGGVHYRFAIRTSEDLGPKGRGLHDREYDQAGAVTSLGPGTTPSPGGRTALRGFHLIGFAIRSQ
jgi:hypothetical protein